ncbi:hypothetical protein [Nocardia sp. NPDC004750]
MSERVKLVESVMSARHVEFGGQSVAEVFAAAADWFAASESGVGQILGVGIHTVDDEPGGLKAWHTLSVLYDK